MKDLTHDELSKLTGEYFAPTGVSTSWSNHSPSLDLFAAMSKPWLPDNGLRWPLVGSNRRLVE